MSTSNDGGGAEPPQRTARGTQVMPARPGRAPTPAGGHIAGLPPVPQSARVSKAMADHHWPIPRQLIQQLPQPTKEDTLEPNGAKVPFSGTGSVLKWLEYAVRVHDQDKAAERTRKRLMIAAIVCFVVGFPALAFKFAGAVLLLLGVVLLIQRWRVGKLDLEDRRLEVLSGTLLTLAPELKEKKPVDVNLDFSVYTEHVGAELGNLKEFQQTWLDLKLPLKDGSQVSVAVTLQVKQKSNQKRKYTKIKAKHREQVVVRLAAPRNKAFSPSSGAAGFAGKGLQGLTLQRVVVQPRHATLVWSTGVMFRIRARAGWQGSGHLLDSQKLVAAVVASYQLVASGERAA